MLWVLIGHRMDRVGWWKIWVRRCSFLFWKELGWSLPKKMVLGKYLFLSCVNICVLMDYMFFSHGISCLHNIVRVGKLLSLLLFAWLIINYLPSFQHTKVTLHQYYSPQFTFWCVVWECCVVITCWFKVQKLKKTH